MIKTADNPFTKVQWLAFVFSVAVLNAWPYSFFDFVGDIFIHYFHISCYAQGFWAGNLLPNWCSSANAGFGSPVPIFYFPLPYMFTNILYPLTFTGLHLDKLFIIGIWAANAVTLVGCLLWFRQYTSTAIALALACLYLWLPYRIEVMVIRSAYAELWLMALLPYVFYALEKEKQCGASRIGLAVLTLLFAAAILTHFSASIAIFLAILILLVSGHFPMRMLRTILPAGLLAVVLAAPWWLTILQYNHFIYGDQGTSYLDAYPNRHPVVEDFAQMGKGLQIVQGFLAFVFFLGLGIRLYFNSRVRADLSLRSQLLSGFTCVVFGYFLFLPISKWLWDIAALLPVVGSVMFPWRMQLLVVIGGMYTCMVFAQAMTARPSIITPLKRGDLFVFSFAVLLLSSMVLPKVEAEFSMKLLLRANIGHLSSYYTIWTDNRYESGYLVKRVKDSVAIEARVIEGQGQVEIRYINNEEIVLDVDVSTAVTIELDHFYFPIWKVAPNKLGVKLMPADDGSGLMRIIAPKGSYSITLENR